MPAVGCHLSVSSGYLHMVEEAASIGGNTFQYFTKNPRGRGSKTPSDEDVSAAVSLMAKKGFAPPLAHAPYTYNPASKDESIRDYTKQSMAGELRFLEKIPGALYNFHPGCHVGQGAEEGIRLTAELLNSILLPDGTVTVLLETMAGKGTELGRSFEELRDMIALVDPAYRDRVGVCLDTCHVHDGGYPIGEDPEAVFAEFDRVIGLSKLKAIHINDSKNPMGAHKDRHEKIGEGFIGIEGFRRILHCDCVRDVPFYLETPCDLEGYKREIALLKELAK